MISTNALELRAGARLLVSGVTVRINHGDRIGFVGRNGAGKSTLAKVLAGETLPAGGAVIRTGKIGYLPQDPRTGEDQGTVIERILSAHSLLLDEEIILKISNLCFDIRRVEIDFKVNDMHDDLLQKTNSERTGFFGLNKLPKIYESTLYLIKDMLTMDYFEYEIQKGKN
jgi:ATPase subunit of ABC transporter with duplicated ATPase domains